MWNLGRKRGQKITAFVKVCKPVRSVNFDELAEIVDETFARVDE